MADQQWPSRPKLLEVVDEGEHVVGVVAPAMLPTAPVPNPPPSHVEDIDVAGAGEPGERLAGKGEGAGRRGDARDDHDRTAAGVTTVAAVACGVHPQRPAAEEHRVGVSSAHCAVATSGDASDLGDLGDLEVGGAVRRGSHTSVATM